MPAASLFAANYSTFTQIAHRGDLTGSRWFSWPLRLALVVPWIALSFIATDGTLMGVHHQYAVPFCVFFLFVRNCRSVMRYFMYNFLLQSLHYKTWPIQNSFVTSFISVLLYPVYTKSWNITLHSVRTRRCSCCSSAHGLVPTTGLSSLFLTTCSAQCSPRESHVVRRWRLSIYVMK